MGVAIDPGVAAQALEVGPQDQVPLLDPTRGILATGCQGAQRVKFWETVSRQCCEQSNTYDFFDADTGVHLFIAQEVSDDCNRCFCSRTIVASSSARQPRRPAVALSSMIHAMPTVMSVDREGCFKPCLSCCVCNDCARMDVHARPPDGAEPARRRSSRARRVRDAAVVRRRDDADGQRLPPDGPVHREGGRLRVARQAEGDDLGGCSELCCSSLFRSRR